MRIRTAKELGLLSREQRRRLGWGQAELAEKVGVSRQWIVAFERGKPGAALGLVLRTLHELGVDLEIAVGARSPAEESLTEVDLDALIDRARNPRR